MVVPESVVLWVISEAVKLEKVVGRPSNDKELVPHRRDVLSV